MQSDMSRIYKITLFVLLLTLTVKNPLQPNPSVSADSSMTEIAFIGDFGADTAAEQDVADLIDGWSPDYIVTVGDNRYGIADLDRAVGKYYCDYLHGVQPGTHCPSGGNATTNRFYPTVGNHDYSDGNGIDDYLAYFDIPGAGAVSSNSSGSELYYDFTLGSVHFVSLNSEAFDDATSAQAYWAKDILENSTAPHQIVLFHRSPYTSVSRGIRGGHMRWPFEEWGADAVITGDDHFYERLELNGIPYFITGAGGKSLYAYGPNIDSASRARYAADYGSLKLQATDESLKFEYFTRDGVSRDSYEISQDLPPCLTSTFTASEDTWLNSQSPATNYANQQELLFDGSPAYGTLMRWDLSSIPLDSIIASPPIITVDFIDTTSSTYEIYEMASDWKVDEATWNQAQNNVLWSGGSGGINDSGAMVGQLGGNARLKENIVLNLDGQQMVQKWIKGKSDNHGILIADYGSATNGADIFHRAQLTIEYCWAIPTGVLLSSAETGSSGVHPLVLLTTSLLLILTLTTISEQRRRRFSTHSIYQQPN